MRKVHYPLAAKRKTAMLCTFIIAVLISLASASATETSHSLVNPSYAQATSKGAFDSVAAGAGRSCQVIAAYLANSGVRGLLGIKLTDIVKMIFGFPSGRKARIKKDIAKIVLGGSLMGVCPPLIVPQGFSQLGGEGRLDYAIDTGWEPIESVIDNYDVDDPTNPISCSKSLAAQLGAQGQLLSGDFQQMEFVYVAPFGSYPNIYGHLFEGGDRIQGAIRVFVNRINVSLPPITDAIEDVQDFIDSVDLGLPEVSLDELIPGLEDFIFDQIAGGALFETKFRDQFDYWRSSLPQLTNSGRITPVPGGLAFPVGRTWVSFDSEINTGFSSTISYRNSVNVKEYFAPSFNVLRQEPDPNDPSNMLNIIAEYRYEALDPGGVQVGTATPVFQQGSLQASDNCDSKPRVSPKGIAGYIPLGINYIPLYATDSSGNRSDNFYAKVIVEDTLAPDINPLENIGIEVDQTGGSIAFDSAGIGCVDYLCQLSQPDRRLFPPVYFDFATITPVYQCLVDNSIANNQACASALLTVGEQSIVRWIATDPSGNQNEILQRVAVRPAGTNIPPTAEGSQVVVAAGRSTEIPLAASDAEFDPLSYKLRSLPVNGSLPVQPAPEFQTRFSLSGTLARFSSGLVVQVETGGGPSTHHMLADPGNRRLLEVSNGFVHSTLFFENLEPHSIAEFQDELSGSTAFYGGAVQSIVIGDWSTLRVHTVGGNDLPDAGFDISPYATNPSQIAWAGNHLIITDPDLANPSNGKLRVLQFSNVDSDDQPPADQWNLSAVQTINLGFNAEGIHRESCSFDSNLFLLLGDWSNQRVVRWNLGPNPIDGNGVLDRLWALNDLFVDPPGEQRAHIGDGQDIYTPQCSSSNTSKSINIVDDLNKDYASVTLSGASHSGSAKRNIGTAFEEILRVEASGNDEFLMLDDGRLVRYDLFGRLLAMVLTREDPDQANQGVSQLLPPGGLEWIDLSVDQSDGSIFLLEGNVNVGQSPQIYKVGFYNAFANFDVLASGLLDSENGNSGVAIAYNAFNDRVYVVTSKGLEQRFASSGFNVDTLLAYDESLSCVGSLCAQLIDSEYNNFIDVATDSLGNIYLSSLFDRVYKLDSTGNFVGWMGRCSAGSACNTLLGRSNGFSCSNVSCSGSSSGSDEGQFRFASEQYGRIDIDEQNNKIRISDLPIIAGNSTPRIQTFSLEGEFENQTTPNDGPQTLIGNFTAVNDLSSADDKLYVVEGQPLKRLHVFDVSPFNILLGGANIQYTPNFEFSGQDEFSYAVNDGFDDSDPALVQISVIDDNQAPSISCPSDLLDLEANTTGGAIAINASMAQIGSILLGEFLRGASASDNVTLPQVVLSNDAPALFPLGDTLVTFSAIDASNLQSSCQALVRVVDTIAPVLSPAEDLIVEASGEFTAFAPPMPSVQEIGGLQSFTHDGPELFPLGESIITWTAIDFSNQSSSTEQRILLRDSTPPSLSLPTRSSSKSHGVTVLTEFRQIAVNGYANELVFDRPMATDAVAIGMPVSCFPDVGDSVAGSVVDVSCTVLDSSANITYVDFAVNVEQLDDDLDQIADFLQDASNLFGDLDLSGVSTGYLVESSLINFAISDAYRADLGIRIDAYPDSASDGVLSARFCADIIELRFDSLANNDDLDPRAASVSCALPRVEVETGLWQLTLSLPNEYLATMTLNTGDVLSIDGYVVSAGPENAADIQIDVVGNPAILSIGGTLDLQPLANYQPTTNGIADLNWAEDAPSVSVSLYDAFDDSEDNDSDLDYAINIVATPADLLSLELNAIDGTLELNSRPDLHGQAQIDIVATDSGGRSIGTQFLVNVASVNDPPVFSLGSKLVVLEDRSFAPRTWATSIGPGAANEGEQSVIFSVSNNNATLYAVAPAINPLGELSFELAENAFGFSTVFVQLLDDGGANNASPVGSFLLEVSPVNDAPSFSNQGGIYLKLGSSGSHREFGWAYDFNFGPENEALQQVSQFSVDIVDDSNQMLDTVSVTNEGDLRYVLTGRGGQAKVSVTLRDNGGQSNGGNNSSTPSPLWFTLQASTDLAVQVDSVDYISSLTTLQYLLTVSNQSAEPVFSAPLSALLPPQLTDLSWTCVPDSNAICPASGTGNINTLVDLPAHSSVEFTIIGTVPDIPEQALSFRANIDTTAELIDFDLSDNEIIRIIPMALFMDSFDN